MPKRIPYRDPVVDHDLKVCTALPVAVRVLFIHVQPVIRPLVSSTNVDRYRRGLDRDVHYTTISKTEWIHFPAAPGWSSHKVQL